MWPFGPPCPQPKTVLIQYQAGYYHSTVFINEQVHSISATLFIPVVTAAVISNVRHFGQCIIHSKYKLKVKEILLKMPHNLQNNSRWEVVSNHRCEPYVWCHRNSAWGERILTGNLGQVELHLLWHQKFREILWNVLGHFEWPHAVFQGDIEPLIARQKPGWNVFNFVASTVAADGLAPIGHLQAQW